MISADDWVEAAEAVLSRTLDDEAVLVELTSGTYFGLNEVGSSMWADLERGARVGDLVAGVVRRYEVDPQIALCDALALLEELVSKRLVRVRHDSGGAAGAGARHET